MNDLKSLEQYLTSESVLARFMPIMGRAALPYVTSVLLAVEADKTGNLLKCSEHSIQMAALNAATLGLSCAPAAKQGYLVAYNTKAGWTANFQPHFLGLYLLAMRSGIYRSIEVFALPKELTVEIDLRNGDPTILNIKDRQPVITLAKCPPEQAFTWFGWMEWKNGGVKKAWMTVEEIHKHASQFPGYSSEKSMWKSPKFKHTMEMKTVLRRLLEFADLSNIPALNQALNNVVDVVPSDITPPEMTVPAGTTMNDDSAGSQPKKMRQEWIALNNKAANDPTTSFWNAAKLIGLGQPDAKKVLANCGGSFKDAFDAIMKAPANREIIYE